MPSSRSSSISRHKAVHSNSAAARPLHRTSTRTWRSSCRPAPPIRRRTTAASRLWVQNQRNSWHGVDFPYHTDRPFTEYMRDYYRTLSAVDDSLGRDSRPAPNERARAGDTWSSSLATTAIMFGEHGLIDKRNAYEPSMRVPMIAYAPGLLPKGVSQPRACAQPRSRADASSRSRASPRRRSSKARASSGRQRRGAPSEWDAVTSSTSTTGSGPSRTRRRRSRSSGIG